MMNDTNENIKHGDNKRPSKPLSWAAYFVMGLILLALVLVLVASFLMVRPYNLANIDQPSTLITEEFTSDGIPVVRVASPINYTTSFCNDGVDITTVRFVDSYDSVEATEHAFEFAGRTSSFLVGFSTFYANEPGCVNNRNVKVTLPLFVAPNAYYKLRTDNSYDPNPLRTIVNTTETELFYLAIQGSELP